MLEDIETPLDIDLAIHNVNNLEGSLVTNAKESYQEKEWGRGIQQLSLEVSAIKSLIMDLKLKLLGLKQPPHKDDNVDGLARKSLASFTERLWPLYGPVALAKLAQDIMVNDQPVATTLEEGRNQLKMRIQKLEEALHRIQEENIRLSEQLTLQNDELKDVIPKLSIRRKTSAIGNLLIQRLEQEQSRAPIPATIINTSPIEFSTPKHERETIDLTREDSASYEAPTKRKKGHVTLVRI